MAKTIQPLEPLTGFVVLKEYKLNQKIAGRLLMPTDAQNQPSLGEVVDIGEPTKVNDTLVDMSQKLKKGDIVAYQNYGGQELTLENTKYLLVPFDKLLAKVNVKEEE